MTTFICAFCGRTLPETKRDEDLRGEACCVNCGPIEDESRKKYDVSARHYPSYELTQVLPATNGELQGNCLLCGRPRKTCCR